MLVQLPSGEIARVLASSLPLELRQEVHSNVTPSVEGTTQLGAEFQSVPSMLEQQQQLLEPQPQQLQPLQQQPQQQPATAFSSEGSGQIALAGGSSVSASDLLAAAGGSLTSGSFIEIDGQLYQIQEGNE